MAYRLRGLANEPIGNSAKRNGVVRNEPVSALYEFERGFGLAYARIARNKHAHAVHIHQNAVNRFGRRENLVEVNTEFVNERGRTERRTEYYAVVLFSRRDEFAERFCRRGKHQTRKSVRAEPLAHERAFDFIERQKITHFLLADDLNALGGKVFVIARKLKSRAGNVECRDMYKALGIAVDYIEIEPLGKVCDGYVGFGFLQFGKFEFSHIYISSIQYLFITHATASSSARGAITSAAALTSAFAEAGAIPRPAARIIPISFCPSLIATQPESGIP